MEHYEVIIIGTGEIGRPLYELLSGVYKTLPVDKIHFPKNLDIKATCDNLHICIPGEVDGFQNVVLESIIKYGEPEFVFIHSTLLPGTTDKLNEDCCLKYNLKSYIINSPVHGKHQNNQMKKDMLKYRKYLGLPNAMNKSTERANKVIDHFERIGFADVKIVWGPKNTEWMKILSTTIFGLQIAFAQEVERICDQFNLNYDEVTDFFPIQQDTRGAIYPGFIGGHCVMPNIKIIKQLHDSELLDWIEWSNEEKTNRNDVELDERGR